MKHTTIGQSIDATIHRKGPSGDYIAYPETYDPVPGAEKDGIHLDNGQIGETVTVEIVTRKHGYVKGKRLNDSWIRDVLSDSVEVTSQQPSGSKLAPSDTPTRRKQRLMSDVNRTYRS
jgi:hypothetical protein